MWKYVYITATLELVTVTRNFKVLLDNTQPFFTRARINDFDIYDKNCASTLELARTRLAEGYPVEFQVHYEFHGSTLILKTLIPGPSISVHLRLCYRVLIWTRCWIAVSEHSLSSISIKFQQTFIQQTSFDNIYKPFSERQNLADILWQRLAFV
jgi:hypothetical protein